MKKIIKITHPETLKEMEVTVKSLNAGNLGKIVNNFSNIANKVYENKALMNLVNKQQMDLSSSALVLAVPIILGEFFDELVELISDITKIDSEIIEELELDDLILILTTIVEINDFEKITKSIKNLMGLVGNKAAAPKKAKVNKK